MAQAGSGLPLQSPMFDPRPMFVGFVVDAVGGQVFPPQYFDFPHVIIMPPILHTHFFHCFNIFHILSCFTNTVESTQFTASVNKALKIDNTFWLSLMIMLWYW